ncbi:MAG: acetyl-CoA carboxylase biotin carboxylase subunit, partial [Pseudonocardia sp.]|nr:acetyl-CoA carboxylase biotin carboxylase subunit [Pseudonocardia sp.]
ARDFAPTPAVVDRFTPPGGPFVRVDTHIGPGYRIPTDYDSLLAKVLVWAPDRAGAIARMDRALGELELTGERLVTTAAFLRTVLAEPAFADGTHDTALLEHMSRDRSPV